MAESKFDVYQGWNDGASVQEVSRKPYGLSHQDDFTSYVDDTAETLTEEADDDDDWEMLDQGLALEIPPKPEKIGLFGVLQVSQVKLSYTNLSAHCKTESAIAPLQNVGSNTI
eukprot:m.115641 g.115641  ORF g.115641 m.115641 type:complete len:113 (-) comp14211_c0_seq14:828-1166(-)